MAPRDAVGVMQPRLNEVQFPKELRPGITDCSGLMYAAPQ